MKKSLVLIVLTFVATVVLGQRITDSYHPGGFDGVGASYKTFSVSDTTTVQFSRGNLQYNASLNKWRFALRQYFYICDGNLNATEDYDGWIDLFGWGTSGWNSGATAYQPWETNTSWTNYYPGGDMGNALTGSYAKADWGIYNKIENGGMCAGMWRTLTADEWGYLVGSNARRSGKWAFATIGGVHRGMLLLPDEWSLPSGCTYTAGRSNGYETNKYSYVEWQRMESAGAVFLPASGLRSGTDINNAGAWGYYWSSTPCDTYNSYRLLFGNTNNVESECSLRANGTSVRLVRARFVENRPLAKWIDMGLPSGTKWYSCNIGASRPEEFGDYFAWGETRPKENYDWSTYKYGNEQDSLTKYCYNADYGLYGFTDTLTILEPEDDAARAVLGSSARMPTRADWQELLDNCTDEWTTINGTVGRKFTSNVNGNSIFLPAAGFIDGTDVVLEESNMLGYSWSSSVYCQEQDCTDPYLAYVLNFDFMGSGVINEFRKNGIPIRAVKSGSAVTAQAFDANGASTKTFTVAEGRTVRFSKGNLQYNVAQNTWRFAENQYDYVGNDNSNISSSYNGWIDIFGWGTSGWNSGANAYQPWATSSTNSDYYPGGSATNSLTGDYANADWGVYNAISNGGNAAGMWRTMTKDEWNYLLNTRTASTVGGIENARYAKATVGGFSGVIILPDDFSLPEGVSDFVNVNTMAADYSDNTYSTEDWAKLEAAGTIFLPAAGDRNGTEVGSVGTDGGCWSGTCDNEGGAWYLAFNDDYLYVTSSYRFLGRSVRLVKD